MISEEEFTALTPFLPAGRRASILPPLQAAFQRFEIHRYLREAAAAGQLLHESGSFRFPEEIASGAQYEGRLDLGNTQRGDGKRYKGRGWIQITGRGNYRRYGQLLGIDLVGRPELAATDEHASLIAGAYWKTHGLNELADVRDYVTITRRINGGLIGLNSRMALYQKALKVLSNNDPLPEETQEVLARVFLNGAEITDDALFNGTAVWAPLRPLATALGCAILDVDEDDARLRLPDGAAFGLPLQIRGSTGFSPVRPLAERLGRGLRWDGTEHRLHLS